MRFQVTCNKDEYPDLYEYLKDKAKQGAVLLSIANDGIRWRNGVYSGNSGFVPEGNSSVKRDESVKDESKAIENENEAEADEFIEELGVLGL